MNHKGRFQPGERVCIISSHYHLPRGTRGTILRTLLAESTIYDVQFDRLSKPQLIVAEWLCGETEWDAATQRIPEDN
jgi:hypothetical protein